MFDPKRTPVVDVQREFGPAVILQLGEHMLTRRSRQAQRPPLPLCSCDRECQQWRVRDEIPAVIVQVGVRADLRVLVSGEHLPRMRCRLRAQHRGETRWRARRIRSSGRATVIVEMLGQREVLAEPRSANRVEIPHHIHFAATFHIDREQHMALVDVDPVALEPARRAFHPHDPLERTMFFHPRRIRPDNPVETLARVDRDLRDEFLNEVVRSDYQMIRVGIHDHAKPATCQLDTRRFAARHTSPFLDHTRI